VPLWALPSALVLRSWQQSVPLWALPSALVLRSLLS
jgi:hypothetical protein